MALINLVTFYHVILTVQILGGFCLLLGWKSSFLSGNTDYNEAFVASSGDIITDYNDSLALHHAV